MGERKRIPIADLQREAKETGAEKRENPKPLFPGGMVCATPEALDAIQEVEAEIDTLLARHITGDWGDVSEAESTLNNMAVAEGQEILSAYHLTSGIEVWIITDAERKFTTLQLPDAMQE